MNSGFSDMTEQDPALPEQVDDRKEQLANFVMELWAQHRHVSETRRRINKRLADETELLN